MRKVLINAVLFSCIATSTTIASNNDSVIIPSIHSATIPIAGYTAYSTLQARESVISDMYMYRTHGDNFYRGLIGEYAMHSIVENDGWTFTESRLGKGGPQGLDGLYVKYDRNGNPFKIMIADAKYGTSKLGMTLDGKQMSQQWINSRLKDAAIAYKNAADDIAKGNVQKSLRKLPMNNSTATIRLKDGTKITIGKDGSTGKWTIYSNSNYTNSDVVVALNKHSEAFFDALEKNSYSSRLYNIKVIGNKMTLDWYIVDKEGNEIIASKREMFSKNGLPTKYVSVVKNFVLDTIVEQEGITRHQAQEQIKGLTAEELIDKLGKTPKLNFSSLVSGAAKSAVTVSALYIPFDIGSQLITKGDVDLLLTAKRTGIAFGSAFVGHTVGNLTTMGIHKITGTTLMANTIGQSRFLPYVAPTVGGLTASAAASYLLYAFGEYDLQIANTSFATNVLSYLIAYHGLMALTSISGAVAGTGTAISALSGAAATNASLAALGGGTVASGGFGIVGGTFVIGGAAVIIAIPVSIAITYGINQYNLMHEKDRIDNLLARRAAAL